VKTRLLRNFGGLSTIGEVDKIDPGAIWRVDVSRNPRSVEFSHGLDPFQSFGQRLSTTAKR
jgi:hypothetical protein